MLKYILKHMHVFARVVFGFKLAQSLSLNSFQSIVIQRQFSSCSKEKHLSWSKGKLQCTYFIKWCSFPWAWGVIFIKSFITTVIAFINT